MLARTNASRRNRGIAPGFRRPETLLATAVVAVLGWHSTSGVARATPVTWVGPTTGNWGTNTNWSGTVVPGGGDDVRIDGTASNVTVSTGASVTRAVNNLTIDAGDALQIDNNATMNLGGNLVVNGTLLFNSTANNSFLNFSNPAATISGSGVIDFNYQTAAPSSGVIQGPGSGQLTNQGTIRGGGVLNNIRFTNAPGGVIENYQAGALHLDANNSGAGLFVNQGTIRALAGSVVTFAGDFGGDFVSTGGNIQANGAAAVARLYNNVSITGGNYSTSGGGEIVVEAGNAGFVSPESLTGTWRLRNNSTLHISGTMNNNGSFQLSPNGNVVTFDVNGALTLNGTGTINGNYTGTGPGSQITTGASTLTLGSGQTVTGVVYFNNTRVINNGLIDANDGTNGLASGSGIYVDPNNQAAGLFVNNATMRSSGGGQLVIAGDAGGDLVNNGTIASFGANSLTRLVNSISVTGGTFATGSGGLIRVDPSQSASLGGTSTLTTGSTFQVSNNSTLHASGTMTNNGAYQLVANGNLSTFDVNGALSIGGTGAINGSYGGTGSGPMITTGSSTLTLGSGQTVTGVVYFNNTRVINNGLIDANDGANAAANGSGIYVDPNNQAAGLFVNNNVMRSSGGGFLVISGDNGGDLVNNGTISAIGTNSITELYNSITVSGGTYTTSGGGLLRVRSGSTATLFGNMTLTAGSTMQVPTNARLNLSGSGVLTNNGTINLNSGTNNSSLGIQAATTIQGTGTVRLTGAAASDATVDGPGTLTIAAGQTIRGDGYFNNMRVINNGQIIGDDSSTRLGGTYLDPNNLAADLFVNSGTIQVTAGNFVSLVGDNGGNFAGTGTYRADGAGAFLHLANNVSISGGNYATTAGGVVRVPAGHTASINNATITAGSTFNVENGSRLNIDGTIVNNGVLTITSGANTSFLTNNGAATLSGAGTVRLASNPGVSRAQVDGNSGTLTIGASQTVAGDGYFVNKRVINNGTILADLNARDMYLDPNNLSADLFLNNGAIRATGGGVVTLAGDNGGNFAGAGPLIVEAGSTIQAINSVGGTMGPVDGAGTYSTTGSSGLAHVHFRVGTLSVSNSAVARVTVNGGNTGASRADVLTVNTGGKLDLNDNDLVVTAAGGMTYSQVATLISTGRNGGAWNGANGIVSSVAAANPNHSTGFGLLTGQEYQTVRGTNVFDGMTTVATDKLVKYTWNGDANFDGRVTFDDYVKIDTGFNTHLTGWLNGDFNYSGAVNFDDYVLIDVAFNQQNGTLGRALDWISGDDRSASALATPGMQTVVEHYQQFGVGYAQSFLAAVPEPAGATALVVGLGVLTSRRRRARRARA